MKKYNRWKKNLVLNYVILAFAAAALTGCKGSIEEADRPQEQAADSVPQAVDVQTAAEQELADEEQTTGISGESAADAQVDFPALSKYRGPACLVVISRLTSLAPARRL